MFSKKYIKLVWLLTSLFVVLAIIIALFFSYSRNRTNQPVFNTLKDYYLAQYEEIDVSGMSDYAQFNYTGLYNYAHTVAVVTPTEALSTANSYGIAEDGDRFYNAHSVRTFQVSKYFKNELGYGETMQIAEKCVLLEDGTLVMEENCYPMEVGHSYLIFLINSGYGYPLCISANNGYFDLNLLSLNSYRTVLIDALLELELAEVETSSSVASITEIEGISDAKAMYGSYDNEFAAVDSSATWDTLTIDTEYTTTGYELTLFYDDAGDETLVKIGEVIYKN